MQALQGGSSGQVRTVQMRFTASVLALHDVRGNMKTENHCADAVA
jgi:hypothetical protein